MSQLQQTFCMNKKNIVNSAQGQWIRENLYNFGYSFSLHLSGNKLWGTETPVAYYGIIGGQFNIYPLADAVTVNVYSPYIYDAFTYPPDDYAIYNLFGGNRVVLDFSDEEFPTIIGGAGSTMIFNNLGVGVQSNRTLREISTSNNTFFVINSVVAGSAQSVAHIASHYSNPDNLDSIADIYLGSPIEFDLLLGARGAAEVESYLFVPSFTNGPSAFSIYDPFGNYTAENVIYEDAVPLPGDVFTCDLVVNLGTSSLYVSAYVSTVGNFIFKFPGGSCEWFIDSLDGGTVFGRVGTDGENVYVCSAIAGVFSISKIAPDGERFWYSTWEGWVPVDHCTNSLGETFVLTYQEEHDNGTNLVPAYNLLKLDTDGDLVWARRILSDPSGTNYIPILTEIASLSPRVYRGENGVDVIVNPYCDFDSIPLPISLQYKSDGSYTGALNAGIAGTLVIEDSTADIVVTSTIDGTSVVTIPTLNITLEEDPTEMIAVTPTLLTFDPPDFATIGLMSYSYPPTE